MDNSGRRREVRTRPGTSPEQIEIDRDHPARHFKSPRQMRENIPGVVELIDEHLITPTNKLSDAQKDVYRKRLKDALESGAPVPSRIITLIPPRDHNWGMMRQFLMDNGKPARDKELVGSGTSAAHI